MKTKTRIVSPSPLIASLALAAANAASTGDETWTDVYPIGTKDAAGRTLYGIQMMYLVPHKGKLYAGNGTQGETETDKYPKAAQILVLDSPIGSWQVEKQFTTESPRINSLGSFTFTMDGQGRPVTPETLLITAPGSNSVPKRFFAFVRNDTTGAWVRTAELPMERTPSFVQPRVMALYRDKTTGIQHLFVGIEGEGVFRGTYEPTLPERIAWAPQPEIIPEPWQRVLGFAEANRRMYLALSSSGDASSGSEEDLLAHVYERIDGPQPAWRRVYTTEPGLAWEDIRGLTAVPDPRHAGSEVLLFTWNDKVYVLDPLDNYQVQVEFDMNKGIADQTGLPVRKVVAAYNNFFPFRMPPAGETVWLAGLSVFVDPQKTSAPTLGGGWLRDGLYLVRQPTAGGVDYQVRYILKNDPAAPADTLMAVRDFAVSPFPEDQSQVLYACGLDHQGLPMSLAAWIYKAAFPNPPMNVDVPLAAGYNLIALPLAPEPPLTAEGLAQQINAQGGTCTSVIAYDAAAGAFVTHPAGTAVSNFTIEVGKGYFVRCAAASTWRARGLRFIASSGAVTLKAGYNLVGLPVEPLVPGKYTAESAAVEMNAQGGGATQIIRYDETAGQFVTHPVGTALQNFSLAPGRGYFIRCTKDSVWTVSR